MNTEQYNANSIDNIVNSNSLILTYLHGGRVRYQAKESLGPRILTDYEIVLITAGNAVYTCNQQTYELPPGSMVLGQPGSEETYLWDKNATTSHAFIHFEIEQIPNDWPEKDKWPKVRNIPDPAAPLLLSHILRHVNEHPNWPFQSPGRPECRMVETLLDLFMETHITDQTPLERDRPEPVSRALKMMKLNIEEVPVRPMTLTDIANNANVTNKHICRLFSRNIGFSPMQTYNLLRLQYALLILFRSNLTIKEIAARCGYEDSLYFSRAFRKTFKMSPSKMRKELRAGHTSPENLLPTDITPRLYW